MQRAVLLISIVLAVHRPVRADCLNNFCLSSAAGAKRCHAEFVGKPILIDFWTSWCPNCRLSLEWLGKLRSKYAEKDLGLVAINLDQRRADAEEIIPEIAPAIEILLDTEGATAEKCSLNSLPATILLGKDGAIVGKWFGDSEKNHTQILESLKAIAGEHE